jgi:DNA-binding response OmpR family regulator
MSNRGNDAETTTFQYADLAELARDASQRRTYFEEAELAPPFYRIALGQVPLQLGDVEFRLLMLLASKPYRPFSRHRIPAASMPAGRSFQRRPARGEAGRSLGSR